jgi:predicted dehydrogenase
VLCEKPFLLDPAVLDLVSHAAHQSGVAVVPVHNWKYAPIVAAASAALREGAIGTLSGVEIETSRLQAAPTADGDRPNWRRDPAMAGGGILMDHGWHAIYLALHWFGARPRGVHATLHHPPSGQVEDEAVVTIEFPGGDAVINLSWNGTVRRNAMRLVGTRGDISIDDDTLVIRNGRSDTVKFASALSTGSHHAEWFAAMLPAVLACFRHPELSRPLFDEARECLAIIQQAYRGDHSLA